MSISKEKKQEVIKNFKKSDNDTGSVGIRIALLTTRIQNLSKHLELHSKDFHCRRGLLTLVGQRKRLLAYLSKNDPQTHDSVLKALSIRSTVKDNV